MQLTRNLTISALAAALIAAGSAQAAMAKGIHYAGYTRDGDPMSFTLAGKKLTHIKASVPTLCGSTDGYPMNGTDPFDPPGSFPLFRTTKVTAKQPNAIWNTSDVTKNFVVSFKRGRHNAVTGTLHSDFSFLYLVYSYPITSRPYVCTGDTKFTFRLPAKH